jgi:CheY-like chemotaxis protein
MKRFMRILVVEDDPMVRRVIVDDLIEAGYSVTEAKDADDAMASLATGWTVELVVTDVRMPGSIDGFGLARWLRGKWPTTKILVVSGFAHEEPGQVRSYDAFLGKPFTGNMLRKAIDRVMEQPSVA